VGVERSHRWFRLGSSVVRLAIAEIEALLRELLHEIETQKLQLQPPTQKSEVRQLKHVKRREQR
jgi:hypothetical protein